jgi:ABC-type nitrate/sulfonate/bicarbonate transport system permease component
MLKRSGTARRKASTVFLGAAGLIAAIALWEVVARTRPIMFLPPVSDLLANAFSVWTGPHFARDAVPSLERIAIGFTIALFAGTGLGIVFALSKTVQSMYYPVFNYLRAIPSVMIIPFALVVFGVGDGMQIFVIAIGSSYPIILNVADGLSELRHEYNDVTTVLQLTRRQRLFDIYLRGLVPRIVVGARLAMAMSLILMVVSEMLGATNGIGYFTLRAQSTFNIQNMWAGVILIGVLGLLSNSVLSAIERRVRHV